MNLIVIQGDNKKALTNAEFKEVKKIFEKVTKVIAVRRNDKRVDNHKEYFNCLTVKTFPEFVITIGKIHEMFGRNIEIETFWGEEDTLDVWFRGYSKELRNIRGK